MRKHKLLVTIGVFLLLLVAMPFLQKALRGGQLRALPGYRAEEGAPADSGPEEVDLSQVGMDREGILPDYGYYPDDYWTEKQCAFYIRSGEKGRIRLELYYPFPLSGGEGGRIAIDDEAPFPFTLSGESTSIILDTTSNEVHHIAIESDFAKEPGAEDKRALAFVLAGCAGE